MLIWLNNFVWDALIYILVLVGLGFTLFSRFVQLRLFREMVTTLFHNPKDSSGVSSFQALALSLGGRVGSGNIAGVAVAISLGGPGAVFWMWVVGLVGMATSFFECSLAQLYKQRYGDDFRGGPAYYIKYGLGKNWSWLAVCYSILLFISFGIAFTSIQSFSVASSFTQSFDISTVNAGTIIAITVGVVIFGGIHRLVKVSEFIVPIVALIYLLCALFVIGNNVPKLPSVFYSIIANALGIEQVVSGGIGVAILLGVKRGLFSNEAGLGSAPNVAATANVFHPVNQGLVQSLSVFIDTIVLCTCTAILILLSDTYIPGSQSAGITLTQEALNQHIGNYAGPFVSIALFFFGFTSIIYNYYLGENTIAYLISEKKSLFIGFRFVTIFLIFWGANQDLATVFGFADLAMGLLAFANLSALVLLSPIALRLLKDYDQQRAQGKKVPVFEVKNFDDLNIDKTAWKNH